MFSGLTKYCVYSRFRIFSAVETIGNHKTLSRGTFKFHFTSFSHRHCVASKFICKTKENYIQPELIVYHK